MITRRSPEPALKCAFRAFRRELVNPANRQEDLLANIVHEAKLPTASVFQQTGTRGSSNNAVRTRVKLHFGRSGRYVRSGGEEFACLVAGSPGILVVVVELQSFASLVGKLS